MYFSNPEEHTKKYKFDNKDLRIVNSICDDARLPYSKIGRLTRISKDRVRERMNRIKKEVLILSYIPLINYPAIGFNLYHIYLRFKYINKNTYDLIKDFSKHQRVMASTWITGRYDFELQILARDKKELERIMQELHIPHNKNLAKTQVLSSDFLYFYSMRIPNSQVKPQIFNKKDLPSKRVSLDSLDIKILNLLSINAREKIIDMSSILNVPEDTIRHRIRNLVHNKVILGFFSRTNKHRLGLSSYIILVEIKGSLSPRDLSSLAELDNVYFVKSFQGRWNLIINFCSKDTKQLIFTLNSIRETLQDKMVNFDLLTILDRHKFLPIPPNLKLN